VIEELPEMLLLWPKVKTIQSESSVGQRATMGKADFNHGMKSIEAQMMI
jgi:hypothetical protein